MRPLLTVEPCRSRSLCVGQVRASSHHGLQALLQACVSATLSDDPPAMGGARDDASLIDDALKCLMQCPLHVHVLEP